MSEFLRGRMLLAGCITALALSACGGGGGGSASTVTPTPVADTPPITTPLTPVPASGTRTPDPACASTASLNIAVDGREWINFRRSQIGMSALTHSTVIDTAAQGHSNYLCLNVTPTNPISHEQVSSIAGIPTFEFTGFKTEDRLVAAHYVFNTRASRAYGEVISATSNGSGQYMAEELITAVYHRFVIFEPVFKEIGTGAATTSQGYNYFTANFTANDGYGAGLSSGQVAVWPFSGQTDVPRNFLSDSESPDPVPDRNEVGYPISVHANIDVTVRVTSFTVRPRGGAELAVRLLTNANDTHTGTSSAAIVPLAPLAANTTYDVSFTGTAGSTPVTRTWSFATR
jgi:uncharacterized protein YkwD